MSPFLWLVMIGGSLGMLGLGAWAVISLERERRQYDREQRQKAAQD